MTVITFHDILDWIMSKFFFFTRPAQVKWQLMVASCHRRSGNYQQALDTYKHIHKKFPDNVECKWLSVHKINFSAWMKMVFNVCVCVFGVCCIGARLSYRGIFICRFEILGSIMHGLRFKRSTRLCKQIKEGWKGRKNEGRGWLNIIELFLSNNYWFVTLKS